MADEREVGANPSYAYGQLLRAIDAAASHADADTRGRARERVERWSDVLSGMLDGSLDVGSRRPIVDVPVWATPDVVHGGFATGALSAERALDEVERAMLAGLAPDAPGATGRERLNLHYLSDAGLARLSDALARGTYRIDLPEHGALLVFAWLMGQGRVAEGVGLLDALRPWLGRLCFTPRFVEQRAASSASVYVRTARDVARALRAARARPAIAPMCRTLGTINPLYDRLVALWCETVDGDLPHLVSGRVEGGWPGARWPEGWPERRAAFLIDHDRVVSEGGLGRHGHARSNDQRLLSALQATVPRSGPAGALDRSPVRPLDRRALGWVRRALANTVTRTGAPGTERRVALRALQAGVAARPVFAQLRGVVAERLEGLPEEQGVPAVEGFVRPVGEGEPGPSGAAIPPAIARKVASARAAPVEDLVAAGIVSSGEVLARVLPQLTRHAVTAGIADPALRELVGQLYGAFRRRRSLLLQRLEHQVRFHELPWVAAVATERTALTDAAVQARVVLDQAVVLALSGFPQALLPNPLVRELGALATTAGVKMPLVEEVAADIFQGTFTTKWEQAARVASRVLEGSLYARYYDLPTWPPEEAASPATRRWGVRTADAFSTTCARRAAEARVTASEGVAANGTVLEQSQILTTHNLAVLVDALDLRDRLAGVAPSLALRALVAAIEALVPETPTGSLRLTAVKNAAYAWRQGIFFLSLCSEEQVAAVLVDLCERAAALPARGAVERQLVLDGLNHVRAGGRFGVDGRALQGQGRRLLGWTVGEHWVAASLREPAPAT